MTQEIIKGVGVVYLSLNSSNPPIEVAAVVEERDGKLMVKSLIIDDPNYEVLSEVDGELWYRER